MEKLKKSEIKIVIFILLSIILSRVIIYAVYLVKDENRYLNFFDALNKQDYTYYNELAIRGYDFDDINNIDAHWAFFPLYPMVLRGFSDLTDINVVTSGFILNNILFFIALFIAAKYIYETRKNYIQIIIFIILLTFGMYSIYFSIGYTESLYFLLMISGLYFLNKKNYIGTGICGAFLSATRITGVFFIFAMLVKYITEYFKNKKINIQSTKEFVINTLKDYKFIAAVAIVPLGACIYMQYLYNITGDALAFYRAQYTWGRETSAISFITSLNGMFEFGNDMEEFYYFLWFTLGIYIAVVGWKEKKYVEFSIWLGHLLPPLLSGQLYSFPRFLIGSIVAVLILSDKMMKMERYSRIFLLVFVCLLELACLNAWYNGWGIMC